MTLVKGFKGSENDVSSAGYTPVRGNLAQWLVFLNGLILTFTAYFALNYFITQSMQADYSRMVEETSQAIKDELANFEYSIRIAIAVADNLPQESPVTVQWRLKYALPHSEIFDRIAWMGPGQGGFQIINLYVNDSVKNAGKSDSALAAFLLGRLKGSRSDIAYMIEMPETDYIQEQADPRIDARPFALVRPLRRADGEVMSLLVGVARPSVLLNSAWLSQRTNLMGLSIRDQTTGKPIYTMNRKKNSGGSAGNNAFTARIGDSIWEVSFGLSRFGGDAILEKMPLFLLLFGGVLTLAGMLYIRSNQNQSYRLASMNRALAKKNYELKYEAAERERLNDVLRNAEREYRAIVDSVGDIIFETNTEGEIIFLNSAWERITGFDISHSVQRSLFDLMHQQEQEEQRMAFKELVRGKRNSYRTFARLRTNDGTFRAVEMAVSMLRLDENRKMRVVGSFTDVEERRRAERALSEAEKKYRAIVENAAGGIFQMTPEGQILSANPAMARIIGFDNPERMLREVRNALDFMFAIARDRSRFLREMASRVMVNNLEVQGKTRTGEKIWLNLNARAVKDDDGNILYFEGSLENITQRKETEIMLREAKIQSDLASRAKSEFLANMSHELRTPLNAIIGFSEIIKDEVLGKLDNRQYWEYSMDIHSSGKKLLHIIDEILDVSRIDAGERQLNEAHVDMAKLIANCLEFIEPRVREGSLKITNMIDGGVPSLVGEELAIKQIMLNLLSNAIKFTPEGGRITLSHTIDADGHMLVSVTDTGIGLDETEIEKALSPFGQVDSSMNRSGSGAGLGLTLVDSLIRLHGGRLELFSQKGIGTTATVIFPAKRVGTVRERKTDIMTEASLKPDEGRMN